MPPAPTPEECAHPAPITGVMAHEFAHYDGAIGPEGLRRTVTYYGPVIGGLPIQAWFCDTCGLLRLTYPDGRKEERRLFPGPQPGLIAEASAVAPESLEYGMQARVSGLSAQPQYYAQLAQEGGSPAPRPELTAIPSYSATTWVLIAGLTFIAGALLVMAFAAVLPYSTPSIEAPLAIIVTGTFVGLMLYLLGVAAVNHFFPADQLSPSVAETARGTPVLDSATRASVTLLVLAGIFLFFAAILAIYTYATPGAEGPVFILGMSCAGLAALIQIGAAVSRYLTKR